MLGQQARMAEASVEHGGQGADNGVAGLVGLAGLWQGTGCISCSAELACKLASHMMMTDYETVGDDVLDAMGEIANMVVGNIKTSLEESLGPMGLSVPTVVYGRNFTTRTVGKHEWTVVRFDCEGSHFVVQMMLTKSTERTPIRAGYTALHRVG
jgi:chemotaxis protein CheX